MGTIQEIKLKARRIMSRNKIRKRIRILNPPRHIRVMTWMLYHCTGPDAAMAMLDYWGGRATA